MWYTLRYVNSSNLGFQGLTRGTWCLGCLSSGAPGVDRHCGERGEVGGRLPVVVFMQAYWKPGVAEATWVPGTSSWQSEPGACWKPDATGCTLSYEVCQVPRWAEHGLKASCRVSPKPTRVGLVLRWANSEVAWCCGVLALGSAVRLSSLYSPPSQKMSFHPDLLQLKGGLMDVVCIYLSYPPQCVFFLFLCCTWVL